VSCNIFGHWRFVKAFVCWHSPIFSIQSDLQLPLITSGFDAMSAFIMNDHTYAGIEDVDTVSISPEGYVTFIDSWGLGVP